MAMTVIAASFAASRLAGLLAEAEADVGRARRGGDAEGYDRGRHDAAHGPQPG